MTPQPPARYCSKACEDAEMARGIRACPRCDRRWNSTPEDDGYCNAAWVLCIGCARDLQRCVVCGEPATTPDG